MNTMYRPICAALLLVGCSQDPAWTLSDVDAESRTSTFLPFGAIDHVPEDDARAEGPHCTGCQVNVSLWHPNVNEDLKAWTFRSSDPERMRLRAAAGNGSAFLTLLFREPGESTVLAYDDHNELQASLTVSSEPVTGFQIVPWADLRLDPEDREILGSTLAVHVTPLPGVPASERFDLTAAFGLQWLGAGGRTLTGTGLLEARPAGTTENVVDTDPFDDQASADPNLEVTTAPWRQAEVMTTVHTRVVGGPHAFDIWAGDVKMGEVDLSIVDATQLASLEVLSRKVSRPVSDDPSAVLISRVRTASGQRVLGAPIAWSWDTESAYGAGLVFDNQGRAREVVASIDGASLTQVALAAGRMEEIVHDWQDEDDLPFSCRGGCDQQGPGPLGAWAVLLGAVVGSRRRRPDLSPHHPR